MKSAVDFIMSVVLLFTVAHFGVKGFEKLEAMAKLKIQKGLPHLSGFTSKMTCIEYDQYGELRSSKMKGCHK